MTPLPPLPLALANADAVFFDELKLGRVARTSFASRVMAVVPPQIPAVLRCNLVETGEEREGKGWDESGRDDLLHADKQTMNKRTLRGENKGGTRSRDRDPTLLSPCVWG